ncbi:hypothetical protein TURU_112088 [Turdus rufiventris]|nr:hypothetical protein TURU_112088 [Turdus rufiventris]
MEDSTEVTTRVDQDRLKRSLTDEQHQNKLKVEQPAETGTDPPRPVINRGRAAKLQDEVGGLKQKNKDPQDEGVHGVGKTDTKVRKMTKGLKREHAQECKEKEEKEEREEKKEKEEKEPRAQSGPHMEQEGEGATGVRVK